MSYKAEVDLEVSLPDLVICIDGKKERHLIGGRMLTQQVAKMLETAYAHGLKDGARIKTMVEEPDGKGRQSDL